MKFKREEKKKKFSQIFKGKKSFGAFSKRNRTSRIITKLRVRKKKEKHGK